MAKLPYTLLVPPLTAEDEAWEEIERKQQAVQADTLRRESLMSAMRFIDENNVIELGVMTLRKAYEIGYRAGAYAEQRKKNGSN